MWKRSEVWKNRKFQILLVVELLLLCIGIVGCLQGSKVVCLKEHVQTLENGGIYEEGFLLTPGVYQIKLTHEAPGGDDGKLIIQAYEAHFYGLLADHILIQTGSTEAISEFYVTDQLGQEDSPVVLEYQGEWPLTITGLEITKTNAGGRILVVGTLLLSILVNSLVMFYVYAGKYSLSMVENLKYFGTLALAMIASLPSFTDYLVQNQKLAENLQQIELLADGSASFSFQSKLFWMLPALFRSVGFPAGVSYSIFVFLINLATVWVAYFTFNKLFKNGYIGMFGSMLYTLMPYRLECIYGTGALGEALAMTFLPVVCYGLYLLFTEEKVQADGWGSWVILTLGLFGIMHSDLLSLGIVACFMLFVFLLRFRSFFTKSILSKLLKMSGTVLLCNLWYLVPVVEVAVLNRSWYEAIAGRHIQEYGVRLEAVWFSMQYLGVFAVLIGVLVFFTLCKEQEINAYKRTGVVSLVVGTVALIMSSGYFPWEAIQISNRITGTLIPLLGSPAKLQGVAAICFTMIVCIAGYWVLERKKKAEQVLYFVGVIGCYLLSSVYQVNDILENEAQILRPYFIVVDSLREAVPEAEWYWHAAKAVSVVGIFLLGGHIIRKCRKKA